MDRRKKYIVIGAAVVALAGGAVGIATAAGGGDDDDENTRAISGAALQRASQAALQHTGGGKVTETEVGDEESLYEVEVTLPDGTQTDVQLDGGFNVVGAERDGRDDEDEADDE